MLTESKKSYSHFFSIFYGLQNDTSLEAISLTMVVGLVLYHDADIFLKELLVKCQIIMQIYFKSQLVKSLNMMQIYFFEGLVG